MTLFPVRAANRAIPPVLWRTPGKLGGAVPRGDAGRTRGLCLGSPDAGGIGDVAGGVVGHQDRVGSVIDDDEAPNPAAGCSTIYREKISGATAERPQLKKLMAALAAGDVVVIPAVDRLSRDTTDLLVIARDMQRAGAGLRSHAEPVVDTTSDFAELVLAMLGVAAKLERRRIIERTARGRADAKANGVKFGRKPSLTPHQQREARERLAAGETQRSVARSYNVSQATISRLAT